MVTWVLEPDVFSDDAAMREACGDAVTWRDDWWSSGGWPRLEGKTVIFHGSLGNAARIRETLWSRSRPARRGSSAPTARSSRSADACCGRSR